MAHLNAAVKSGQFDKDAAAAIWATVIAQYRTHPSLEEVRRHWGLEADRGQGRRSV